MAIVTHGPLYCLLRELVQSTVPSSLFDSPLDVELKGLAGTHTLYDVQWASAPAT